MADDKATASSDLQPFSISLESDEHAVRHALRCILVALAPLDLSAEDAHTVELVLAEALNNIVKHAYQAAGKSGPITVTCAHRQAGLDFRITDNGQPMQDSRPARGNPVELGTSLNALPDGGFGWFIIQTLAKNVSYGRREAENQLSLHIEITAPLRP